MLGLENVQLNGVYFSIHHLILASDTIQIKLTIFLLILLSYHVEHQFLLSLSVPETSTVKASGPLLLAGRSSYSPDLEVLFCTNKPDLEVLFWGWEKMVWKAGSISELSGISPDISGRGPGVSGISPDWDVRTTICLDLVGKSEI